MDKIYTRSFRINAVNTRTEYLNGVEYLVAPVVAIREGVLNGELILSEEISRFVQSWNGVPLTINHPQVDGIHVSASSSPEVLEQFGIGLFMNAKFEDDSLKGECWINVEKCKRLGGEALVALERIQKGLPVEVSTGYFAETKAEAGVFNEKPYVGVQSNIVPDHLALLPNAVGACSWQDGCGTPRTNKNEERYGMKTQILDALKVIVNSFGFDLKGEDSKPDKPITINLYTPNNFSEPEPDSLINNGRNFSALLTKIIKDQITADRPKRDIIKQLAEKAGIPKEKVQEILDGNVSFIPYRWLEGFASALDVGPWDLLEAANLDGMEFIRDNLPAFQAQESDGEKSQEVNMEDNKELIENEEVVNKEESTEVSEELETQEETEPEVVETNEESTDEVEVNEEELEPVVEDLIEEPDIPATPRTLDEFIDSAPEPYKAQIREAFEVQAQVRSALTGSIVKNSEFNEEDLGNFSIGQLRKLNSSLKKKVANTDETQTNYVRPLPKSNRVEDNSVPAPPSVLLKKKD